MSRRFECAVAIPAHNALPDVLEAIESALGQTLPPVEIVVVDASSTDGTGDEIRRRLGVRVSVVSTTASQPPSIADELRRQAEVCIDLMELQPTIRRE